MRVILDGKCLDETEASISVSDRGFLCGDGVFTTIQVREGKPLCLGAHFERLERHCCALHIAPPQIDRDLVAELISANDAHSGIWRLRIMITGGDSPFKDMTPRSYGHVFLYMRPYDPHVKPPCHLKVYPEPVTRPYAFIKSLAYLDRYWVKEYARTECVDEAIVLSPEGYLLEAAYANLFWRFGNDLYTPDPMLPLIHGISLNFVLQAAQELGITIHKVKARLDDIPKEAGLYMSNALIEFLPIVQVNDRTFSLDPTFESKLRSRYDMLVSKAS